MIRRRTKFTLAFWGALLVAALATVLTLPYLHATAFLIDASGQNLAIRRLLPDVRHSVTTRDIMVPTRHGEIPARLYLPSDEGRGLWIAIPGVHAGGVDEPRMVRVTTRLAAEGMNVLSLPLPDLREYRVSTRSTDMIEDATLWATNDTTLAPRGKATLLGISFAGGLTMVAAGRTAVADRVAAVVSFGGHGDLPRTIEYLCTGRLPDGTIQPAHDYGLAILLLTGLPHLVPAEQVAPLDAAVRAFLDASIADGYRSPDAPALFEKARRLGEPLQEPSRSIMADVAARDPARLGPRLRQLAEVVGGDPSLSPERSPLPRAPVFLIHGAMDNVIPQSESASLGAFIRARSETEVTTLITPAVSHADALGTVRFLDVWRLVKTWTALSGHR